MADWKQITARIRRARASKNPAEQLSNLFQKTRDAMVAFELGRHFETAGESAEAVKWYTTAAQRFRRSDWKNKSLEALARLGGQVPSTDQPAQPPSAEQSLPFPPAPETHMEPELPLKHTPEAVEAAVSVASEEAAASQEPPGAPLPSPTEPRQRRRGRRGGRRHRKGRVARPASLPAHRQGEPAPTAERPLPGEEAASETPRIPAGRPIPPLPVEPAGETVVALRGRYGDPGLSSRLSLLEMQLRRLLTCPPAKLDHAQHAPVGPGVFLLTDEDMTSYYYVEACDTLRVAVANLLRGDSGRRGAPSAKSIRSGLADHLGIPEGRVGKYLADHCVVRWLQLDEGAPQFAHFTIAVLRPILNE